MEIERYNIGDFFQIYNIQYWDRIRNKLNLNGQWGILINIDIGDYYIYIFTLSKVFSFQRNELIKKINL